MASYTFCDVLLDYVCSSIKKFLTKNGLDGNIPFSPLQDSVDKCKNSIGLNHVGQYIEDVTNAAINQVAKAKGITFDEALDEYKQLYFKGD